MFARTLALSPTHMTSVFKSMRALAHDTRGAVDTSAFVMVATGFILIVFGSVMSRIIIDTASTTGSQANIGSFTGTRSLNDLVPFVVQAALVLLGVGLMALGGVKLWKGKSAS